MNTPKTKPTPRIQRKTKTDRVSTQTHNQVDKLVREVNRLPGVVKMKVRYSKIEIYDLLCNYLPQVRKDIEFWGQRAKQNRTKRKPKAALVSEIGEKAQ